jgi:hypothetical protein
VARRGRSKSSSRIFNSIELQQLLKIRFYSERPNKIVIARSEALHRMVYRAKRRGNPVRLLHGVYPEQNSEILRFAQNDKRRRVRNDPLFNVNLFKPFTIATEGECYGVVNFKRSKIQEILCKKGLILETR